MDILNTKIKQILTEKSTKIKPENIKSGINILGVQGSSKVLDTTDANAVANDIVTGKTAYVNGQKLTGTYAGIIPSGSINIIQNGTTDVSQYASANVNVPIPTPNLQNKSITITENGTNTITPDTGYDGLDEVEITTNVSSSGGDITHEEYLLDVELARSILEDFIPYTELQYIESTGTQYIDTGYKPNQNTKIDIIMESIDWGDYKNPFGIRTATYINGGWVYTGRFATWLYNNKGNILQIGNDGRIIYSTTRNYTATKFNLVINNGNIYIKDLTNNYEAETFEFTPVNNFTADYNLLLGAMANNGTEPFNLCKYKLYSCQIYENDTLIKDWIPVIDKMNNKVCLYDKVNENFLYNSGTGNMIAGGVV